MNDPADMLRVAVLAQVPPPIHGQALMTRVLLEGRYEGVELIHVPTRFSSSASDIGRVRTKKVIELLAVVRRLLRVRRERQPQVLYYVPAPPALVPVLRDLVLLNLSRRWFRYRIFHFHAGGVSGFETRLPRFLRPLFRRAYSRPDVAIHTSRGAPNDGAALSAGATRVVLNGIPDPRQAPTLAGAEVSGPPRVLYLGAVTRDKGVMSLIEAGRLLRNEGRTLILDVAGPCPDPDLRREILELAVAEPMAGGLALHGIVEGDQKWGLFRHAALFCFPSLHPSETFGVTMIEAMAWGLPVVASNRRGAPEIVDDGLTGYLFSPGDAPQLARRLAELLDSPALRAEMGARGRARYERCFSAERFRESMQAVFDSLPRDTEA